MIDKEVRIKAREENAKILSQIDRVQEEVVAKKAAAVARRLESLKARVVDLQEDKSRLLNTPPVNEELLKAAKAELKRRRQTFIDDFLLKHLLECKERNLKPFTVNFVMDLRFWEILFLAITEKDIEDVVSKLPGGGLSTKEKLAKVKEIESQVEGVIAEMTRELEEAGQ